MKNIQLSNYCRWNETKGVSKVLDESSDIDLTYENGIYFRLSIKHNNIKMLKTLLEYYEKTQLQGDSENQYMISLAKHKLQIILQDAVRSFDISSEMQKILNQYLPKEDDNDSEQGLEDIEIPTFNIGDITTKLIEDNLKKLEALENNQTKTIENLLGFGVEEIHPQIEEHTTTNIVVVSGNLNEVH